MTSLINTGKCVLPAWQELKESYYTPSRQEYNYGKLDRRITGIER